VVDPAEFGHDRVNGPLQRILGRDIADGPDDLRFGVGRAEGFEGGVHSFRRAPDDADAGLLAGEEVRSGQADARGAAGDEDVSPLESEVHS
jgi:hypothetical protein